MLKKPVVIEVLHTDEFQQRNEDLFDIKTPLINCEPREMTFFHIDCIGSFEEGGVLYTSVFSGGNHYLTRESFDMVFNTISNSLQFIK
jgi:hypothetical protein